MIFVTHDLREAYLLADRFVVLDDGKVLQADARNDVFSRSSSRRVAELLGVRNLYRGRVLAIAPDSVEVEVAPRRWRSASWVPRLAVGDAVDVAIRSERVVLHRSDRPVLDTLEATVEAEETYGTNHVLHMCLLSGGPRSRSICRPVRMRCWASRPRSSGCWNCGPGISTSCERIAAGRARPRPRAPQGGRTCRKGTQARAPARRRGASGLLRAA